MMRLKLLYFTSLDLKGHSRVEVELRANTAKHLAFIDM